MRILKIADDQNSVGRLDEHFEEVERVSPEETSPKVLDDRVSVNVGSKSLEEFDAVFARIPRKNAVFGRVLLEIIEEKAIPLNYSSTAFFTMAKKNYLFHVLKQKDIPAPKSAVVADEKAARNLEEHLKGPLEARRVQDLETMESTRIESVEEIQEFAEGVKYGNTALIFSELSEGDKYRCFVAGETVISLYDSSEGWEVSAENLSYSNLSSELEETVLAASRAIGAEIAEVLIRDGQVVDVNPNPDLELYMDVSGKNPYEAIAEVLKPE